MIEIPRAFKVAAKRVKAYRRKRHGAAQQAVIDNEQYKLRGEAPTSRSQFAERWLLMSNCQTYGLASALQMVNPDVSVTPIDLWTAVGDPERTRHSALEGGYTRVLVSPEIEEAGVDLSGSPNLTRIPRVVFTAFHPDCVYALSEGQQVKGPLDAYHSMTIIAAHRRGLSVNDAQRLFNGAFFEQAGFMDYWVPQRDRLVADYARFGLDISADIRRWGRTSSFMHTIDHPKMICLYDIARAILRSTGVPDFGSQDLIPPDNLSNGVSFAVYPEIGEMLGVPGGYRFKRFNDYRHIPLEQLIGESYSAYDRLPVIQPDPGSMPAFNRVLEAIG